jgi:hypothetical protein
MRPTNYFKVRGPAGEQIIAFDHWRPDRIREAFRRATSCPGRVSVFFRVPLSGPWDSLPAIAPLGAAMPVARRELEPLPPARLPTFGPLQRFAPFGEGGCF